MNVFELQLCDWDGKECFLFSGPKGTSEEKFKKICEDLIPEASYLAVLSEQVQELPSYVGTHEMVKHLVNLLKDKGFNIIETKKCIFESTFMISEDDKISKYLGSSSQIVKVHNSLVEKEQNKYINEFDSESLKSEINTVRSVPIDQSLQSNPTS